MRRAVLAWVLCVAIGTTGCTSMKPVRLESAPAAPFGRVKAGDTVIVLTKDGRTDRFVVAEVIGSEIVSKSGGRYARDEVVKVERKSFSPTKTVFLGLGIYLGVSIVVGLMYAVAFMG